MPPLGRLNDALKAHNYKTLHNQALGRPIYEPTKNMELLRGDFTPPY